MLIHTVYTENSCSPWPDTCAERHGTTMAAAAENRNLMVSQINHVLSSKMSIL